MAKKPQSQPSSRYETPKTLGARIFRARVELTMTRGRKVTQESLGAMVSKQLRKGKAGPVTVATVSRWESGDSVPDLQTVEAIAAVCETDPGWLAFGERSDASEPWSQPRGLERLTRSMVFETVEKWLSENKASGEASRAVRHLPWLTHQMERIAALPDLTRARNEMQQLNAEWGRRISTK